MTDEPTPKPPAKRVERVTTTGKALHAAARASDSYALLLGLLILDYFLLAALDPTRVTILIRAPLVAFTLLLALRTSHAGERYVRIARVGAAFVLIAAIVFALTGALPVLGAINVVNGLLLLCAPAFILARILGHERVGTETILGALCVYILIGLVFASVFIGIDIFGTQHFAKPLQYNNGPDLLYLSFVTLTTVGYGDVVAAHDLGRALVVLEAVVGQIFLITLVARLVAMFGEERRKGRS